MRGAYAAGNVFLILIGLMSAYFGASFHERELLNSMVTYTLLASMVWSNTFSMVMTRFVADSLYSGSRGAVLPAFWGSTCVMLISGEIMYGILWHLQALQPCMHCYVLSFWRAGHCVE